MCGSTNSFALFKWSVVQVAEQALSALSLALGTPDQEASRADMTWTLSHTPQFHKVGSPAGLSGQ